MRSASASTSRTVSVGCAPRRTNISRVRRRSRARSIPICRSYSATRWGATRWATTPSWRCRGKGHPTSVPPSSHSVANHATGSRASWSSRMKYGIYAVLTATTIAPKSLAQAIEERGFDSMWVPEHSHIPLTSTYPGGVATITREYGQTLDPFVALAAAASVTERIGLGTGICLLTQRATVQLAKVVATLDHLSNGRMLFGVGGGWNKPEMENHGTTYATRFQKLEEQLEAMKDMWAQDEPDIHGEHARFDTLVRTSA